MVYTLLAPAKINIALDVVGLRSDGYHELRTVMQTLPLCDELTVEHGGGKFEFTTDRHFIVPETDISLKAAKAFYARTGTNPDGLKVHTRKRIPVGAGLGGGSSDGAAVLLHLNEYHAHPLSDDELCDTAKSVGADLPFFIMAGLSGKANYAALCEGIGEKISEVSALRACTLLLAKPRASLSTAAMFRFIDSQKSPEHPDIDGLVRALGSGDLREISSRCFNSMEQAAALKCRDIPHAAAIMRTNGALGACMSGSGSTVFGIFADRAAAAQALNAVRDALANCETHLLDLN